MIKKIIKLVLHPLSEYKKISPFLYTKYNHLHQSILRSARGKDFERLKSIYPTLGKIRIHFGCGPRVLKGWINIDLAFEPYEKYLQHYTDKHYPESIRGDKNDFFAINILHTGLPFPDNSVDLVFHEDFIEHLDQKEQVIFLSETFRVLKPGSVHRVNTPSLIHSMQRHSNFEKGISGVYTREWTGSGHKNLFTPSSLKEMAHMIGYSRIEFNGRDKSISKEIPTEYRPGIDREEDGNIFADLIK